VSAAAAFAAADVITVLLGLTTDTALVLAKLRVYMFCCCVHHAFSAAIDCIDQLNAVKCLQQCHC
jgi:hypothetical protein